MEHNLEDTSMAQIKFYEGGWYFLSNFSAFAIEWKGELWPAPAPVGYLNENRADRRGYVLMGPK